MFIIICNATANLIYFQFIKRKYNKQFPPVSNPARLKREFDAHLAAINVTGANGHYYFT